jgi:hypothetical protein
MSKDERTHKLTIPEVQFFTCNNKQEWWYQGEQIPVNNLKEFQSYIRNKAFW